MEVTVAIENDVARVRAEGEVTAESCGDLRKAALDTLPKKPKKVVLDLAGVPFMDTSGIGVLVGLRTHMKSKGVVLEVENPSAKVRQVLKMTRLLAVFGLKDE